MHDMLFKEIGNLNRFLFIRMPESTLWLHEFIDLNKEHLQNMIKEFTKKSMSIEKLFYFICRLIIFRINDKYQFKDGDEMYDFVNLEEALKPIKEADGNIWSGGEFMSINIY